MKVILPIHLVVGMRKPKKLPLNLNHYRNAYFHQLNSMKVAFKEQIKDQLTFPKITEPVKLTYVLYPPTQRKLDIANVLSIVDKYFCDALTEEGLWLDDNYEHLPEVTYKFGSVDKNNPRAEVFIEVLNADYN